MPRRPVRLRQRCQGAILGAAGCTFDDVIDGTVLIVDPESKFETIWKVGPAFWCSAPHPTSTDVGVTWRYGFEFEIKVIAKLPETTGADVIRERLVECRPRPEAQGCR